MDWPFDWRSSYNFILTGKSKRMPPPTPKLQSSGYEIESLITTSRTTTAGLLPRRVPGQSRLTEADVVEDMYRIPTLHSFGDSQPSPKKPTKPARPELRHGRSISNPFPSFFQSKGKRQGGGASSSIEPVEKNKLSQAIQTSPQHAPGKGSRVPDKDPMTGNCMTCSSTVRWPKELLVFRCTVCLTINDLEVTSANMVRQGRDSSPSKLLSTTRDMTSSQGMKSQIGLGEH